MNILHLMEIDRQHRAKLSPRALLPRSLWTKRRTDGRMRSLFIALRCMTNEQRLIARKQGWDRGMVRSDGTLVQR